MNQPSQPNGTFEVIFPPKRGQKKLRTLQCQPEGAMWFDPDLVHWCMRYRLPGESFFALWLPGIESWVSANMSKAQRIRLILSTRKKR